MLLAARNVAVSRRIFGPHHDDVALGLKRSGDVAGKRSVAAFVPAHHDAVHPDGGSIIHRAKIEPNASASPIRRNVERRRYQTQG